MVTYDEDSDRNNSDDDESGLLGAGPLFFFITKEDISRLLTNWITFLPI